MLEHVPMRNEDGEIRHEFVDEIARAIEAGDTTLLRMRFMASPGSVHFRSASHRRRRRVLHLYPMITATTPIPALAML